MSSHEQGLAPQGRDEVVMRDEVPSNTSRASSPSQKDCRYEMERTSSQEQRLAPQGRDEDAMREASGQCQYLLLVLCYLREQSLGI